MPKSRNKRKNKLHNQRIKEQQRNIANKQLREKQYPEKGWDYIDENMFNPYNGNFKL